MASHSDSIGEILLTCEEKGIAHAYVVGGKPLEITSRAQEVFIVSDFHAAGGKGKGDIFSGTENFFADRAFGRFLEHANESLHGKRGLLVLNGDFVDFLRIVSVPGHADMARWRATLAEIGIDRGETELEASISADERERHGLKTNDFKSVWKLHRCFDGHPRLFEALGAWLVHSHSLLIVKGNHDLEWFWLAVRNCLRLMLGRAISERTGRPLKEVLVTTVFPRLTFADAAVIIDHELYVEHGHSYDRFSKVIGGPLWGEKNDELNIPFGSFVNRYLLNSLELVYPYLDNVRPQENILHLLMRERFFLGLKVLVRYVPFTISMIPKRYAHFILKPLMTYACAVGIPIALVIALWWNRLSPLIQSVASHGVQPPGDLLGGLLVNGIRDILLLFFSYIGARFVSWVKLEEPGSLLDEARKIFRTYPSCRFVTMGHTHNPEQYESDGHRYVNTSTWIPIVEASSGELRMDRTYAVLTLFRDSHRRLICRPLQRWNDDAGRLEELPIVARK